MQNGKARRAGVSDKLAQARKSLAFVTHEAKEVAAQDAHDGVPEAEIARDLGVSRMTIRKWLGKST